MDHLAQLPDEMLERPSMLTRLFDFFGAQNVPGRHAHEVDRTWQRTVGTGGILIVWVAEYVLDHSSQAPSRLLLTVSLFYFVSSFLYRQLLQNKVGDFTLLLYLFLILDSIVPIVVLFEDPQRFAFLNPYLLVVIVRTGIRYGIRSMYLSWTVALLAAPILLTKAFWQENVELTLSLFLMLLLVPAFFASLTRRVHNIRALEEDRARLTAIHEVTLARSSFLAKVSHELRSPLQGIVSALDVLAMRHGPAKDADSELINRVRRSSSLLNTQLRDLLTLAKGEAGSLEMRPEPFDANELVESVASSASELAMGKGLELVVDLPATATLVVADGARIDQVLTNLVINSIRYTHAGQVRIALNPYDPIARLLHFTISDTGPGIPAELLPNLLAPDRVPTGPERRGEGSGIGLAVVRTLVIHLGGTVDVDSEAGKGTKFTLNIPAEPLDATPDDPSPDTPTGRVLVIDDRDDVLDAIASVVDELGFECDRAPSSAVAANLLASRLYDTVIVDVNMPVKTGVELAAETRRGTGPNRSTRFIGMSASDVHASEQIHFDICLVKPIERAALRHALLGPGQEVRPSQPGLWVD